MKRKTSNSPYPILYPAGEEYAMEQGYEQAHFDVMGEPTIQVNGEHNLVIDFDFDLTDKKLKSLVEEGIAKYYVNVECGHTYFRHAYVQSECTFHREINYGEICDSIEIFIGLVADRNIDEFTSPSFARRYGSAKFNIEKGDILAVGTGWTVELEGVDGNVEPYIYVSKDASNEHSDLWVNGTGDKLIVNLEQHLYDIYFNKKAMRKAELIALVMRPAILSALQSEILKMRERDADGLQSNDEAILTSIENRRWLRKLNGLIERVLSDENMDWSINAVKLDGDRDKSTLMYAVDALLKRPLVKAFDELNRK